MILDYYIGILVLGTGILFFSANVYALYAVGRKEMPEMARELMIQPKYKWRYWFGLPFSFVIGAAVGYIGTIIYPLIAIVWIIKHRN